MFEDLAKKISETFHPEKIILFGSNAWGEPNKDSDVDLFIIMETDEPRLPKRAIEILKKCHPRTIPVDMIIRTPKEVEERLISGDPFIRKIIQEGKVLYDRSSR